MRTAGPIGRSARGLMLAAAMALAGPLAGPAAGAERHAGTIVSVDPDARRLSLDELGENAVRRTRELQVSPGARVAVSERIEPVTDFARVFRDTPIEVADLRPGDYVVVEMAGPGVAERVTVTLRRGVAGGA